MRFGEESFHIPPPPPPHTTFASSESATFANKPPCIRKEFPETWLFDYNLVEDDEKRFVFDTKNYYFSLGKLPCFLLSICLFSLVCIQLTTVI